MKCPKCNSELADKAKVCFRCGTKINYKLSCNNTACSIYGKAILPHDAVFCPECGFKVGTNIDRLSDAPFHVRHPEYNLIPAIESPYRKVASRWDVRPEYYEDVELRDGVNFLYIAWRGKLGILRYEYKRHWYGNDHKARKIIPCNYDKIEKKTNFFICYKDGKKIFLDRNGSILK